MKTKSKKEESLPPGVFLCEDCNGKRIIGDWPFCPDHGAEKVISRNAARISVYIDISADGRVSYPATEDSPLRKGYERRQLTTGHEVRRFLANVDKGEATKYHLLKEAEERAFSDQLKEMREDVISQSKHFSQKGRDALQAALRLVDSSSNKGEWSANTIMDQLEYNRSNMS